MPNASGPVVRTPVPPVTKPLVVAPAPAPVASPTPFALPKYPAAVVYEGAQGKTVKWRLYLCLAPTAATVDRTVSVDVARLGTPIERTLFDASSGGFLYAERLDGLTLRYVYQASFVADPNGAAAYGTAGFNANSAQGWFVRLRARGYRPPAHTADGDLTVFNYSTKDPSRSYAYSVDGTPFTLTAHLEQFSADPTQGTSHAIAVCEKVGVAQFLVFDPGTEHEVVTEIY